MPTLNGREARVTVNADTTEALVLEIGNWNIDMSADEIDTTAFGDGWGKSDVGMLKWSGSMSGFFDPTDSTGQDVLEAAFLAGTLLTDIRFYSQWSDQTGESLVYHTPGTGGGLRVTAMKVSQDKAGVANLELSFTGSGPVQKVTGTVA